MASYREEWFFRQIKPQRLAGGQYPQPHRNRICEIFDCHERKLSDGEHWILSGFAYLPRLSPRQWERLAAIEQDLANRGLHLSPF